MSLPLLGGEGGAAALVDAASGRTLTYEELAREVRARAAELAATAGGRIAFLASPNSVDAVIAYLAALCARVPLVLVPPAEQPLARLARVYRPAVILAGEALAPPEGHDRRGASGDLAAFADDSAPRPALHGELALLLTTSGTTGSPKLVRLGLRQLASNARAIADVLGVVPGERAFLGLPMTYSYGLSVVNSHLAAGATVVVTGRSFLERGFWAEFDAHRCTSFAGVPYAYETLDRLRFDPARHPTLRTMTQAGGRLGDGLLRRFDAACRAAGARFFTMYGQTEATARIAYVPPEEFAARVGTIGRAIPGGALRLGAGGELVYEGPNVMSGYAETPADLARGDDLRGVLATGDLAEADGDSFRVVGRLARFAKLAGTRVSLDDVEREVESEFRVRAAVVERTPGLAVFLDEDGAPLVAAVRARLVALLETPPATIDVRVVAAIPLTASQKKDYRALTA